MCVFGIVCVCVCVWSRVYALGVYKKSVCVYGLMWGYVCENFVCITALGIIKMFGSDCNMKVSSTTDLV